MPSKKFKCACGVTTRKTGASATKALFKKKPGGKANGRKKEKR
mgnify:CR=1 FL=1